MITIEFKGEKMAMDAVAKNFRSKQAKARAIVDETATLIEAKAKALVPVDTGYAREQIRKDQTQTSGNLIEGSVTSWASYSAALEFGMQARDVFAKRDFMKFWHDGREWTARKVHLPARAAQPFMLPALRSEEQDFKDKMGKL